MRVLSFVNDNINGYPSLFKKSSFEESAFLVLHHAFIVLGNGLEWALTRNPSTGGYITNPKYNKEGNRLFDEDYGTIDIELKHKFEIIFIDISTLNYKNPYPYFEKTYSPFWEIDPQYIQTDWKQAAIKHLAHWKRYFNDKIRYRNYYALTTSPQSYKDYIERHIKSKYPDNWVDIVKSKDGYEFKDFDGKNYEDLTFFMHNKILHRTKKFLDETLLRLREN